MPEAVLSALGRCVLRDLRMCGDAESARRMLMLARQSLDDVSGRADEAAFNFAAGWALVKLGGPEPVIIGHYRKAFDLSKGVAELVRIRVAAGTYLPALYAQTGDLATAVAIGTELALETNHDTLAELEAH